MWTFRDARICGAHEKRMVPQSWLMNSYVANAGKCKRTGKLERTGGQVHGRCRKEQAMRPLREAVRHDGCTPETRSGLSQTLCNRHERRTTLDVATQHGSASGKTHTRVHTTTSGLLPRNHGCKHYLLQMRPTMGHHHRNASTRKSMQGK